MRCDLIPTVQTRKRMPSDTTDYHMSTPRVRDKIRIPFDSVAKFLQVHEELKCSSADVLLGYSKVLNIMLEIVRL